MAKRSLSKAKYNKAKATTSTKGHKHQRPDTKTITNLPQQSPLLPKASSVSSTSSAPLKSSSTNNTLPPSSSSSKVFTTLMAQAKKHIKTQRYQKAIGIYLDIIEQSPEHIEAYMHLAQTYASSGQYNKAIKCFKKILSIDPGNTEAVIGQSVILNDLGLYHEGEQLFQQAKTKVKQTSTHPSKISRKGNNLSSAVPTAEGDPHINKRFALKHRELAELYFMYERFDESLLEYQKASKLNPEDLDIRIHMAKTYAKKGLIYTAFEELKRLKIEYPDYLPTRVFLGVLYYASGHIIEAQEEWSKTLAKDPGNPEALMYLDLAKNATETHAPHIHH